MITLKGSTQVKKAIVQQFRDRVTVVRNGPRHQFMVDPIVDYETLRKLPTNKHFALKLFSQVEAKLMKNPSNLKAVNLTLNQMMDIAWEMAPMTPNSQCHFTPINFVYKCSTTSAMTKCRMINNYSDHSTAGEVSLNSCLQPVVDLENGIQGVLLQIRSYPVTSHADVAKWFHQIAVSHKFRPLTTFFCRCQTADGQMKLGLGDPNWNLQPLQIKSLSMGLSQSPLFAIICKQQVGDEMRRLDVEAAEQVSTLSYF